jgi:hypothetical protein
MSAAVALARFARYGARMATSPSRAPLAGGFLLAMSLLVGVVVGATRGQPSLGFVAGLGVGLALLLVTWLIDRRRG